MRWPPPILSRSRGSPGPATSGVQVCWRTGVPCWELVSAVPGVPEPSLPVPVLNTARFPPAWAGCSSCPSHLLRARDLCMGMSQEEFGPGDRVKLSLGVPGWVPWCVPVLQPPGKHSSWCWCQHTASGSASLASVSYSASGAGGGDPTPPPSQACHAPLLPLPWQTHLPPQLCLVPSMALAASSSHGLGAFFLCCWFEEGGTGQARHPLISVQGFWLGPCEELRGAAKFFLSLVLPWHHLGPSGAAGVMEWVRRSPTGP